jgi:hypothetical protein
VANGNPLCACKSRPAKGFLAAQTYKSTVRDASVPLPPRYRPGITQKKEKFSFDLQLYTDKLL